jgi:hypothetical protein
LLSANPIYHSEIHYRPQQVFKRCKHEALFRDPSLKVNRSGARENSAEEVIWTYEGRESERRVEKIV